MNQEYWQRQIDKPLFPNLLWSRPETKLGAGKLLIIGGQAQEFIHVAESFAAAEKAGAGIIRVVMPDSTRKITKMLPNIEYGPSNLSGSFAKNALAELVDASQWADGVLLAGDLGKNSETNLMLENFITKHNELLIVASESLQSVTLLAKDLFLKENIVLVLTFDELQKIGIELGLKNPIISSVGNPEFAQILHEITRDYKPALLVMRDNYVWTAHNGNISLTQNKKSATSSAIAAEAAVWSVQNPSKLYHAITTAIWQVTN